MTICNACPLLCEWLKGEEPHCTRRDQSRRHAAALPDRPQALIDGQPVSDESALAEARKRLIASQTLCVSGQLRSVEGSREALRVAARYGGDLDPAGSDSAFRSILATQRTGGFTATLSEVAHRTDVLVLIGDDRLLEAYPRLLVRLLGRSAPAGTTAGKPPQVVAMGRWSAEAMRTIRESAASAISIAIDLEAIPQALFQWSRLVAAEPPATQNPISQALENARYLSLVWSASTLPLKRGDLWIERLQEWILERNETHRCVAFPLTNDYVTFQQVCTWTTGFPGRVRMRGEQFRYDPFRDELDPTRYETLLRIDEGVIDDVDDGPAGYNTIDPPNMIDDGCFVVIAPRLPKQYRSKPHVFLPCRVAGIEHAAHFFRTDAVVVLQSHDPLPKQRSEDIRTAAEWLYELGRTAT